VSFATTTTSTHTTTTRTRSTTTTTPTTTTTTTTTTTPTTTTTTTPTTTTSSTPTPAVTLTAAPPAVAVGGQTTLTWTSADVTACTAGGAWSGPQATTGTLATGSLTQTQTYTLTCSGPDGSASTSVTVAVNTITVTKIGDAEGSTSSYASFGSWDQHVVSNQGGVFVAYSYEDDNHHTPDYWRLARSTDGGKSFQIIYDSAQDGSNIVPPAVETDQAGNVYVIAPTNQQGILAGPTLFYRFSPSNNYGAPSMHKLSIGGAGKYSTVYDPTRNLIDILFWAYGNPHANFFSVTPAGAVAKSVTLFTPGDERHAVPEYPILTLAPDGTIFAGWSTLDNKLWDSGSGTQNYYDAHFLASADGGTTWIGPGGPVSLPVLGDDTGPTFEIVQTSDPTQFQPWGTPQYTGNWNLLQSMAYNKGQLSFFYGGPLPQPHNDYARMNWSTRAFDERIQPYFGPSDGAFKISGQGGSFSQDATGAGRLYFTGVTFHFGGPRPVIMYSDDGGETWYEGALSDGWSGMATYVNSARELGSDGSVIGSFDVPGSSGSPTSVYFFRSTPVGS
jgi:hypothetical protein